MLNEILKSDKKIIAAVKIDIKQQEIKKTDKFSFY